MMPLTPKRQEVRDVRIFDIQGYPGGHICFVVERHVGDLAVGADDRVRQGVVVHVAAEGAHLALDGDVVIVDASSFIDPGHDAGAHFQWHQV